MLFYCNYLLITVDKRMYVKLNHIVCINNNYMIICMYLHVLYYICMQVFNFVMCIHIKVRLLIQYTYLSVDFETIEHK